MTDIPAQLPGPIVVVDDDRDVLETFRNAFEDEFVIHTASNGRDALDLVERLRPAVLVADQRMPDLHGVEVIRRALACHPMLVPIVLTGFTDYHALVKAMNIGRIFRYIPKPWEPEELRDALNGAVHQFHLVTENARLTAELSAANERLAGENAFLKQREAPPNGLAALLGTSDAMDHLRERIRRVLTSNATVLITGPTGTGKELVARAIHQDGPRRDRLFAAVNCAVLGDELLSSELFGHRRGSFTGAVADKKGLFQLAEGGTVFLDEITETSVELQAKLLRVLAERAVQPLGDLTRSIPVDVRVIAASNRDLEAEVKAGRFREDLFFRLNVVPVSVPPLTERRSDIPLLAEHFLRRYCAEAGRGVQRIAAAALLELERRDYRGNVRELCNLIERGVLLSMPDETIDVEHLFDRPRRPSADEYFEIGGLLERSMTRYERALLVDALDRCGGNRGQVADHLGIGTRWLSTLLKKHGLGRGDE